MYMRLVKGSVVKPNIHAQGQNTCAFKCVSKEFRIFSAGGAWSDLMMRHPSSQGSHPQY